MTWYKTGTVSITNGSTSVTGTGTDFINGAQAGDGFVDGNNQFYEIASITSATVLVLVKAYSGTTASGQSYAIVPLQSRVKQLADSATTLVNEFTQAGAGKFNDGTESAPGIGFTGDVNTGLYRPGSDQLGFTVGGSKVLELTSTGATVTRHGSDGAILNLKKDGTTVGAIGYDSGNFRVDGNTIGLHLNGPHSTIYPSNGSGGLSDNAVNLGISSSRFKDIYLAGGVYLGGTGSANKLDDYEEGTWTPVSGTGVTLQHAKYTKIGRQVTASATITHSAITSYNYLSLPFTPDANSNDQRYSCGISFFEIGSGASSINIRLLTQQNIGAAAYFWGQSGGQQWTYTMANDGSNGISQYTFSFTYFTA